MSTMNECTRYLVKLKSTALQNAIYSLDDQMHSQEEYIKILEKRVDAYRKEIGERASKDIAMGQTMIDNTLMACMSVPTIDSIGPVGATVIARIRDMNTIKEVRAYINQICDENKDELDRIRTGNGELKEISE